jgi:hypothetical protein
MKRKNILLLSFTICMVTVFAQNNLNTNRIGVWPYGWGNTVACYEDLLFLSYGRVVQIYDYIDPEQPLLKGEVFMDDRIGVFVFKNGKAFTAGQTGFYILDVANPEDPEIISSFEIPSPANAISLSGNFAILALNNNNLYIIDISDIQNPFTVVAHDMQHSVHGLVMKDGLAWMAAGSEGIMAYDLSNLLTQTLVYHYPSSGLMLSLEFVGDHLFAFNRELGLMSFEIGNLPDFNLLSTTYIYGFGSKISVENNIIAITLGWIGFAIYDISNPADPDSLGTFYADIPNRNVILKNGYAFHCNASVINIFDLSNPQEIDLLAQIGLSVPSLYLNYWENHLFITSPYGSVMAVDVTDPQQTLKVWQIDDDEMNPNIIHSKDSLLFQGHLQLLKVYDISEPSNPVYLNTIVSTNTIYTVLKHNNLLFVTNYSNLQVFDISDIYAPELLGVYPYGGIKEMVAEGDILYCVRTSEFLILDISNPANLSKLSGTSNFFSTSLAIKDTLAYVVSSHHNTMPDKSIHVFNVKDPTSVFIEKSIEPGRRFEKARIDGDYLYVFEGHVGLHIYDIQDITPVVCGFYNTGPYAVIEMAVDKGIIYVPVSAGVDIVKNDLLSSAGNIFIERNDRLKVFPNPASEMISFVLDDILHTGTLTYEIIQINGSYNKSGRLASDRQQISLHGLSTGVYVLHVFHEGKKYKSAMFIKQ